MNWLKGFIASLVAALATAAPATAAALISGQVQLGGSPLVSSTITLWAASAIEPRQLAQTTSSADGRFELRSEETPGKDVVLYVFAKGGAPKAAAAKGANDAIALMALLGTSLPESVTVNELTTVASAFTAAQFIKGESISGHPLGLRIAAGNVSNLVDPVTGGWGKVLLDPVRPAS